MGRDALGVDWSGPQANGATFRAGADAGRNPGGVGQFRDRVGAGASPKLRAPGGVKTQAVFSDTQGGDEIDWALREKRNRELGLRAERQDLADRVEHVALVDSRAGYDIRLFEVDGSEIFIEMKTTSGQGPRLSSSQLTR